MVDTVNPSPRTGGFIPKIWPQRRSLFFGAVDFHHCCACTVDFEIYAFPLCVGPVGMRLDFVWCVLCVCPVLETLRFSGKIHIWRLYLYCIGDFWDFRKKSMYGFPLCVSVLGTLILQYKIPTRISLCLWALCWEIDHFAKIPILKYVFFFIL